MQISVRVGGHHGVQGLKHIWLLVSSCLQQILSRSLRKVRVAVRGPLGVLTVVPPAKTARAFVAREAWCVMLSTLTSVVSHVEADLIRLRTDE